MAQFMQPQSGPVRANNGNGLARGLAFAWSAGIPRQEITTGRVPTAFNVAGSVGRAGRAINALTGQQNVEWPTEFIATSSPGGGGDFTILAIANPLAGTGAVEHVFAQKNDAGGTPFAQAALLANSSNATYAAGSFDFFTYNAAISPPPFVSASGMCDGGWHVYVGVRSGFVLSLYRDGLLVGSSNPGVVAQITQSSPQRYTAIGSRGNGTTESYQSSAAGAIAWNRALSAAEVAAVSSSLTSPWQIFKALPRTLFLPAAVQLLRPTSDLSTGTWTTSSGPSLFAMLNEAVADDTTFDVTSQASAFKVGLSAGVNPGVTTGHIVRYRIVGSQTVSLMQGATVIASWAQAPTVMTTFAQTLTGVQAASITDYAALSIQFQAT